MAENEPNLAQDLIRIHKVITRGLKVSMAKGREFMEAGYTEPTVFQGYKSYAHSLASVLAAHHQGEDQIAFPALRSRLPNAPYEKLAADHLVIESLLVQVNQAEMSLSGKPHDNALKALVDRLNEIFAAWEPHIQKEEFYFSKANVSKAMSLEEQGKLSAAMGKDSQARAQPPALVVPFVLYNLEPADRSIMASSFPPTVINELIPKMWKDQWAPMKPFLLE
jgi:hemerythrin-like domain-containing protein